MSQHFSRSVVTTFSVVAIVGALGIVAASPLVLKTFDIDNEKEWQTLSNIGQTYGAISAVLSVLAISGIAASLVLQAREARAARIQNERMMHVDILKMAMTNPQYLECWGGPDGTRSERLRQQHMYVNLILSHCEMMYEVGEFNDVWVAEIGDEVFTGEIGRSFWKRFRETRFKTASTRRALRVQTILEERYWAALETPPRNENPPPEPPTLLLPDRS